MKRKPCQKYFSMKYCLVIFSAVISFSTMDLRIGKKRWHDDLDNKRKKQGWPWIGTVIESWERPFPSNGAQKV